MILLKVEQLTKKFGSKLAVDQLSFTVADGRCVALLGPNGAGKTTTLLMLAGLLDVTSGMIEFAGSDGEDVRSSIGYLPQYPAFFNWMTGKEFLVFTGRLAHQSKKLAESCTNEILERVGLIEAANRRIGGYSGGMKQRLGLAQAIIHKPKLLILDEPVSALDPFGRREVLELLQELKQETTILFSTHVLHDAEAICDDVWIINNGRLTLSGDLQTIMQENQQPIIHIAVSAGQEEWLRQLSAKEYVFDTEIHGLSAKLTVSNLEQAKAALLKEIVEQNIAINKFEAGHTTLEDLFIKAVRS